MKGLNFHNMIGLKGTVLIGQNRVVLVGQSCAALTYWSWMWKTSVLLAEIQFQELLYNDWLGCQEHSADRQCSAGGMRFSAGFFLKCGFCDNSLFVNGYYTMFLNLNPFRHQKPFLIGISFLKVHRALRWN